MTRTIVHRPTSSINHHRSLSTAAAAGLVGTLLAITLGSANAMPGRDHPAVPANTVHTHGHSHGHYVARGCSITPHTLNEAVIEALPICYTYVP